MHMYMYSITYVQTHTTHTTHTHTYMYTTHRHTYVHHTDTCTHHKHIYVHHTQTHAHPTHVHTTHVHTHTTHTHTHTHKHTCGPVGPLCPLSPFAPLSPVSPLAPLLPLSPESPACPYHQRAPHFYYIVPTTLCTQPLSHHILPPPRSRFSYTDLVSTCTRCSCWTSWSCLALYRDGSGSRQSYTHTENIYLAASYTNLKPLSLLQSQSSTSSSYYPLNTDLITAL